MFSKVEQNQKKNKNWYNHLDPGKKSRIEQTLNGDN